MRNKTHIWRYFTLEKKQVTCKFCEAKYYKNATRMYQHLLNCKKCPCNVKSFIRTSVKKNDTDMSDMTPSTSSSPCSRSRAEPKMIDKSYKTTSSNIMCSFIDQISKKEQVCIYLMIIFEELTLNCPCYQTLISGFFFQDKLETKLSKTIFNSAYPLRMVEDDNWKTFFKELRPSFKLPSRYELSHRLLDNAYTETNKFVESKLAEAQNLSIMCDGWTNIRNEGIINFIVTTPEPVFVKCVETATNKHTSQYIKELLEDVLKTYNPQKFVCIITDNASNMRKAAKELEEIYPHSKNKKYFNSHG